MKIDNPVRTAADVRERGRLLCNILGPSLQATIDALEQRIPEYQNDGTVGDYITLLAELGVEVEAIGRALLFHELTEPAAPDTARIPSTAAPASEILAAARKAATQRLPTSDAVIAAAREAVAAQLDGRAAG